MERISLKGSTVLQETMIIFIEKTGETQERDFSGSAKELVESFDINPVTVIVAADRKLIPIDTDISAAKKVDILTIVSGG